MNLTFFTNKRVPRPPAILEQQSQLESVEEKLSLISTDLGHRPLIDRNPGNSKERKEQIALEKEEKQKFAALNLHHNCDKEHYNQRSMVERVNKLLKEDFGCNTIYYKGGTKVASVLAFGILSVCIHQSLKLVT